MSIVLIWLSNYLPLSTSESVLSAQSSLRLLNHPISDQPILQHRVAKRQSGDSIPEDRAICNAELSDVACTVGIKQGQVEARLIENCYYENIKEAQMEANSCAKSESGQFCGSLLELYKIRSNYIEGNCSRLLTANSCPSNCRSLLEDFRSTLGCCINAYVNGSGLYSGATVLDYRVWNMCGVPLPPAPCENGPMINPPDNVQECTGEGYFNNFYAENLCIPERRQAYIDVLESSLCGDSITASNIEDACSVDTNGIPCGILYYRSLDDLAMLDSTCGASSTTCTSNCSDGIILAKKRYGCCFRSIWFNISGTSIGTVSYLSPSVLRSCNIDLPGSCKGLLFGSAVSIMKTNHITLIVTALMCLQLMMTA